MRKRKPASIKKKWLCPFDEYHGKKFVDKPYLFSMSWLSCTDIYKWFGDLRTFQCSPAIRLRGRKWRVHINSETMMYDDSEDLYSAFRKAFKSWKKDGMKTSKDTRVILYARENDDGKKKWVTAEWRIV